MSKYTSGPEFNERDVSDAPKARALTSTMNSYCTQRIGHSAVHRIDQTLHSEQLGDRQPSKFLRLSQRVPSSGSPNPILRELFPSFSYHKTYECFPPFTENLDKYATTNGEDTFTQIP
ncbi:hypothetical protein T12_1174 [Trichinella patagoniensis]|uniref:Uncharacterized protein n=1 Tax=Trichinella patagoniensis TaxID=990121 RepID=A0A0V0ZPX4_9BILA|nr:hypothetical protein T12_1174 [Trichinella patagoniensis]